MAVIGFYQLDGGKNEAGQGKLTDKYSQTYPNSLLHVFLRGVLSNDFSYITNIVGRVSGQPAGHVHFRVKSLPTTLTGITLKARAQTTEGSGGPTADNRLFTITLWQGDPSSGDEVRIHRWKIPDRDDGDRPANDTFFDISQVVATADLLNITKVSDLWLDVGMEHAVGFTVERLYWLALQVTSKYSLVDTPSFKNYANSLIPITVASAIQKGTTGSAKWRYRIVPCDSDGVCSPSTASEEFGVDDGNEDLDVTDHICLSWLDVADVTNYKVYRTKSGGTPSSLGLIATVLPDLGDCGGGGGGGDTGVKDEGDDADESDQFDESLCQGPS